MDNLRLAKEEKAKRNIRSNFTLFKRCLYKRYQHAPHLERFDQCLMQVARYVETGGREGIGFLVSEMPPRHGKSLTLSRFFPAWFLGRNPDYRVMNVSYGATLAEKSSRLARNLIASPLYQWAFDGVSLDPLSKSVDAWNLLNREGGMDAMGVLGGATGKGAHILNLDDLLKNREEAESQIVRSKVWDALVDDLLTRLEPGGAVILNATRWHEDDPIGRALKHLKPVYGDKMVRVRFPAIAEHDDPIGREEGEPLWSERYPLEVLERIRASMGEYSFSALYQQHPVPAEGGIFKRSWFIDEHHPALVHTPPIQYAVRYWDLAMSEKTSADFTAGVKVGVGVDGHRYVLDVFHERVEWGDLTERMAQVMLEDGASVAQGIESKGYMSRAIAALNVDPRLHGYQVWGYEVDKDKLTRALPAAAKASSGVVHVLDRFWTDVFLDELCGFPYAAHDDLVDAFAGAEAMLGEQMTDAVGGVNYAETTISVSPY